MALIDENTTIQITPPFFLRVKEFFGNSGQMDSTINKWLEDNEDGWVFKGSEKEKSRMIKNHESSKTLLVLFGDKSVGKSRTLFNLVIKLAGGDSIILKKELEKAGFLRNGKVIKVWTIRDRE